MPQHHHDKINSPQDIEHLGNAQPALNQLHDGGGDGLGQAEPHDGNAGGQPLLSLKPQHQGFYRGQIANAQANTHDTAVADKNTHQGRHPGGKLDTQPGTDHAGGEAEAGDQRGAVYIPFHHPPGKGGRHPQKEDGQGEGPPYTEGAHADVLGDGLLEGGPAVDGANGTVDEQGGYRSPHPFVFKPVHENSLLSKKHKRAMPQNCDIAQTVGVFPGAMGRGSSPHCVSPHNPSAEKMIVLYHKSTKLSTCGVKNNCATRCCIAFGGNASREPAVIGGSLDRREKKNEEEQSQGNVTSRPGRCRPVRRSS